MRTERASLRSRHVESRLPCARGAWRCGPLGRRPVSTGTTTGSIRRGAVWGSINSFSLRIGTFVTGLVLARILSPEEFGVYAIALTAQLILVNIAELGLTPDLIRHGDLDGRGPTLTSLSLLSGAGMFALVYLSAPYLSAFMGASEATPVVRVLSLVVLISALGVVPAADIARSFAQQKQFASDAANFGVSTVVTIALALLGLGAMSLALGRLAGQAVGTGLQFLLVRRVPRLGWNGDIAAVAIRFGLPLALANVLSWVLLTADNAIVGRLLGPVALGFYVLAFNVSSWPMSVIGAAVRSVSLPAFAQSRDRSGRVETAPLSQGTALVGAVAIPAGVMLAALATPLVHLLYGEVWLPAAEALVGLALFGALRVVMDLWVSFLTADGASRAVLVIQVVWVAALLPAMWFTVERFGLAGAGTVHVVVAVLVAGPAYLVALRRNGVALRGLLTRVGATVLISVPPGLTAHAVAGQLASPFLAVLLGGLVGTGLWAVLLLGANWVWSARRSVAMTPGVRALVPRW